MSTFTSTSDQTCNDRLPTSFHTNASTSEDRERRIRYTFYHPEGNGFFHVRYLGSGFQGTACLVRCRISGELSVRKRCFYVHETGEPSEAEIANMLTHPNVVKCSNRYTYNLPESKQISTVTYWRYASHLDLRNLLLTFRADRHCVPELVIWRFLRQIMGAINQFHQHGLAHNDAHESNIFVNWDHHALLPDFVVGDLGCTRPLAEGTVDLSSWHDGDERQVSTTDFSSPSTEMPSLASLLDFKTYDGSSFKHSSQTQYFLKDICDDFALVLENLSFMMSDTRYEDSHSLCFGFEESKVRLPSRLRVTASWSLCASDAAGAAAAAAPISQLSVGNTDAGPGANCYSEHLNAFKSLLEKFCDYLLSDRINTYPQYQHLFDQLYDQIRRQEAHCRTHPPCEKTLEALRAARTSRGRNHGGEIPIERLRPCICTIADKATCARGDGDVPFPSIDEMMHNDIEGQQQLGPGRRQQQDADLPKMFRSRAELEECGFRPPGPWCVAMVDGMTGQIIQVDSEARDLRLARCTNGQGEHVRCEPWLE